MKTEQTYTLEAELGRLMKTLHRNGMSLLITGEKIYIYDVSRRGGPFTDYYTEGDMQSLADSLNRASIFAERHFK